MNYKLRFFALGALLGHFGAHKFADIMYLTRSPGLAYLATPLWDGALIAFAAWVLLRWFLSKD
jgi:hypothetical protein